MKIVIVSTIALLLVTLTIVGCDGSNTNEIDTRDDPVSEECTDACSAGATQCDGNVIQECDQSPGDCYDWFDGIDCDAAGHSCEMIAGAAECVDPCAGDVDCDGVLAEDDCDDNDPNSNTVSIDGDCDGILTADDCDDTDPLSTAIAADADCDGAITEKDCDDTDPTVKTVDDDMDCNGAEDLVFFEKLDYADATDPANQDCITPDVCLTRADSKGWFNAVSESEWNDDEETSPADTEFAVGLVQQVSSYTNWLSAVGRDKAFLTTAAMHLISDDLYFNTMVHAWTRNASGGGFAYVRSNVVSFAKPDSADWTAPENQDCLAPGVCLTRQNTQSLFNIELEDSYTASSPADTEWAMGATAEHTPGDYLPFTDAVSADPQGAIGAVISLHVISLDIYYDIVITSWSGGGPGGGFAYERSRAIVPGCTDPEDVNYNPLANVDNGLCGEWDYFEKADYADHTLLANQDCLVPDVCITRADSAGLFNASMETHYDKNIATSPFLTLWASMPAADTVEMDYNRWKDTVRADPTIALNQVFSVHLPTFGLYYDVVFIKWTRAASGGGFAYYRRPAKCADPDVDCDGVIAANDCDDTDNTVRDVAGDADCDGLRAEDDCNDSDPSSNAVVDDRDCDGFLPGVDCDDTNGAITTFPGDADCDGVDVADDCNDSDPGVGAIADDADCDGALTDEDCDDGNSSALGYMEDANCDGTRDIVQFERADYVSPYVAPNRDCINGSVCLSRTDISLLFNTLTESGPTPETSPDGVEFARGFSGEDLVYTPYLEAVGQDGRSHYAPLSMHLTASDTHYNTMFYKWTPHVGGGGFAYARTRSLFFTKTDGADWTQPGNQDCLAPDVCLTRQDTDPLFNIAQEPVFGAGSPAGTEWAMGPTIDAASWQYQTFMNAVSSDPTSVIDQVMSLHITGTNIYYDVVLTGYNDPGGGFSYVRSRALIAGCTEPSAPNYDPRATVDDGYCGNWVRFQKMDFADPGLSINQDCFPDHLCITRGDTGGLFNAVEETEYDPIIEQGPKGSLWAPMWTDDAKPVNYRAWWSAVNERPEYYLGRPISLTPDDHHDEYYDVVPLQWNSEEGGGFMYVRRPAP